MADKTGKTGGVGLMLSGGGEFTPKGDVQHTPDGTPYQLFTKDMLRVGVYTHPVFGWDLDITAERLDLLCAAFKRMQANGVDVEVPVDHSFAAADNRGYLREMYRDGDVLYGVHELRGEAAIKLAATCKNVSVWIEPDYADGAGNAYGEAIIHSSIVQQPVVPGQGEFVPIAASHAVAPPTVLVLSQQKGDEMKIDEIVGKVRELLGAGDDLTAENMLSRIGERLDADKTKLGELGEQITALTAKVDEGGKGASKLDPNIAETLANTTERELSMLVEKGNITPATQKKLSAALCGVAGGRNGMALSVNAGGGSLAASVVDALRDNDPVVLGEQTNSQAKPLGRQTPGGTDGEHGSTEQAKAMGDMAYGG